MDFLQIWHQWSTTFVQNYDLWYDFRPWNDIEVKSMNINRYWIAIMIINSYKIKILNEKSLRCTHVDTLCKRVENNT